MIATATTNFKQGNQRKLSISYSNSKKFNLRNHLGEKKCKLAFRWSQHLLLIHPDRVLTSSFSVSTLTTNTNVSKPTTSTTTSQAATENRMSVMEKSIACLVDTLTRFIEGQKRLSSGTASRQRY